MLTSLPRPLLLLLATLFCLGLNPAQAATAQPELGLQTWTFNRNTLIEAADKAKALGISSIQAYPRQTLGGGLPGKFEASMPAETREELLAILKEKGVTITSIGVVRAEDEAGWRQLFKFAKALGVRELTCEPKADALPILDALSQEYNIPVSIHNHGGNLEERLDQLKPYGSNMGLCADTGHWVRAGRDPVASLKLAQGRILSLHLKDQTAATKESHNVPWGTGVSNVEAQLAELNRQGFTGIIYLEYEHRTPALDDEVRECVEFYRKAATQP